MRTEVHSADKIIMSKKDILPTRFPVKQDKYKCSIGKPCGLWYGIGTSWLNWVKAEMPHWMGKYFYKVYITDKVLIISNKKSLMEFHEKYSVDNIHIPGLEWKDINWEQIAIDYSGIEISPYQYECRFKLGWYYTWDVASGCIWKRDGLSQIRHINNPIFLDN